MASTSVYDIDIELNTGEKLPLQQFKGKKMLLVNTASDCGFTGQYESLQKLHETHGDKMAIIGFPSNDFGEQEKGSDEAIAGFCKINYGVTFPIAKKAGVKNNADQQPIYQWLTQENKNGWNYVAPNWNFCKYIIDEEGNLTHFFDAAAEPMGKEMTAALMQ